MLTLDPRAVDSNTQFAWVSSMYRNCLSPSGVLHTVTTEEFERANTILGRLMGIFGRVLEEPIPEQLFRQTRSLRWDLLTECRRPALLAAEHRAYFREVQSLGEAVGLTEQDLDRFRRLEDDLLSMPVSPLAAAIEDLLADPNWEVEPGKACIVPFGRFESVAARRSLQTKLALSDMGFGQVAVHTLKELRERPTDIDHCIFIGSPAAFGPSVVTCPTARVSHFLSYEFIKVDYQNGGWQHSFSGYQPGLPDAHWMSFEHVRHGRKGDLELNEVLPDLPSEPENVVTEDELYPLIRFNERVLRAKVDAGSEAHEVCVCIRLEDDLWTALPGNVRVLFRQRGVWQHSLTDPNDCREGDIVLLLQQEPTNLADETSEALEHSHSEGYHLWLTAQSLLRNEVAVRGWPSVRNEIVNMGLTSPYQYWFDSGRLGPQCPDQHRKLCLAAGLNSVEATKASKAISAWRSYRVQAGHRISDQFCERAISLLANLSPQDDPFEHQESAAIPVELENSDLGRYAICRVSSIMGIAEIPSSRTRRVLNEDGLPWRG